MDKNYCSWNPFPTEVLMYRPTVPHKVSIHMSVYVMSPIIIASASPVQHIVQVSVLIHTRDGQSVTDFNKNP